VTSKNRNSHYFLGSYRHSVLTILPRSPKNNQGFLQAGEPFFPWAFAVDLGGDVGFDIPETPLRGGRGGNPVQPWTPAFVGMTNLIAGSKVKN
jgi:hypothetical protein